MKRVFFIILILLFLFCVGGQTLAADESQSYLFELSIDGKDVKEAQTGDIITVTLSLDRTDTDEDYTLYGMQDEIRYDGDFFELVEGSALLSEGVESTDIAMRDNFREFYMNSVSFGGGQEWDNRRTVGSFQLKVTGKSGSSKITNEECIVSLEDGTDSYRCEVRDVTVVVTDTCTVRFETNGGSAVADMRVKKGDRLQPPAEPVKDGYYLEGWYKDVDLGEEWDFKNDTVEGNMTLYAGWQAGTVVPGLGGGSVCRTVLWALLIAAAVIVLILLVFCRKVRFVTGTRTKLRPVTVFGKRCLRRPKELKSAGMRFAGWFTEAECINRWDFENDKVKRSMTLYAKWEPEDGLFTEK